MTKRKRTPPPTSKPITFSIPPSLMELAAQCRDLREQTESILKNKSQAPVESIEPNSEQALDRAVDEQLNAQLNETVPLLSQAQPSRRKERPHQDPTEANEAVNPSDEALRQSIIRDAEQQLGLDAPPHLQNQSIGQNAYAGPQQYYDQSSSVAQIRFDPYITPNQTPYSFATQDYHNDTYPPSDAVQATHQHSGPMNNHNAYAYQQPQQMMQNYGMGEPFNPYANIAPRPGSDPHQLGPVQFSFPVNQNTQPGYYRLPASYWQTPPPLETSSMTEANQRTAATVAASHSKQQTQQQHQRGYAPVPTDTFDYSSYGDLDMDDAGHPDMVNGGVFRNLTKDRFGRYGVGGKLVG